MRLSVIIPTHNRFTSLSNVLSALARQSLSRDQFEVIVVDDGSGDDVRRQLRSLRGPIEFVLLQKEQGGLASARNAGARRASGEILHFLDDDVLPDGDSLTQHLASHDQAPESVAVVGALPYPPGTPLTAFLWYLERSTHYDLYKNPRKYPGGKPPMPPMNGNSSIPRELFFQVGAYDDDFKSYGSEDLDLGHRLAGHGVRFVYNPLAIGYHDHIKSFSQFCGDMETAGESLIRLYERYPEIKTSKKIDIVEDPLSRLPWKKKGVKTIMSLGLTFPSIMALPRWLLIRVERLYFLRRLLFPFYRWVSHHHYAVGMRRGLARIRGGAEAGA